MQDPLDRLPLEIISKIISFLEQNDCLESMLVCRAWFDKMPTYTVSLWNDIFIQPDLWEEKNRCLLECLGPHVQNVHIPYDYMHYIIPEIVSHGCNVTKLLIQPYYEAPPNFEFFNDLRKIGSHITNLSLCHIYDVSILEVARICPQLTHLEFGIILGYDGIPVSDQKAIQELETTNDTSPLLPRLAYLILDDKMDLDTRIAPILRHCPNLRILELRDAEYTSENKLDIPRLVDLCPPHLYHLICYNKELVYGDDSTELQSIVNSKITATSSIGLKRLSFYHGNSIPYPSINDTTQLSQQIRDTLTSLSIHQNYSSNGFVVNNWFNPPIVLPNLQQFELTGRFINTTLVGRLLDRYNSNSNTSTFDSQLDTIGMSFWSEVFDNTLIQDLTNIRSLTSLTLHSVDRCFRQSYCGEIPTSVMYNTHLFQKFQQGQLREIELIGDMLISDSLLLILSDLTQLQRITLGYFDLTLDVLSTDNSDFVSSLVFLVTRDGLLKFLDRIIQHRDRHALQHLTLVNFYENVDDSVIQSIGNIRSLKSLDLRCPFGIHDAGLKGFIDKKVGNGYLERVDIHGYKNLTRDGIEYARHKSSNHGAQFASSPYASLDPWNGDFRMQNNRMYKRKK
ncbi:hypothetical protein BDA99DRAFT_544072 [Phascolomyces articulosus]|uniref:F-box domain-containing protein n=1 Tax=Phascolomyces articulosus TaxID=60185 RepID=A0AAD5P752_9FUNG|nr:hypothetical protein BDA99DRAFT_544072 [Phascolomyces articulosus]